MQKVRLASVGLGNWAGVLARAIQRGTVAEIVNCYSRQPETRASFVEKYGVGRSAGSLDDLLADPEVEGILVTTPNDAHMPVILEALDAGKAVFTDKPLAHDMEAAAIIREAVARSGQVFSIGHSARRLSGNRRMKALIDDGTIGGVSIAEGHYTTRRGLSLTADEWRFYADQSPGGPLIQLGVHHTDTLQYLLGPVAAVTALARRLYTKAEVPDAVTTLLEFESGALGYLGTGSAAPALYQMRIMGTEANLHYDVDLGFWDKSDVIDEHSTLILQRSGTGARETLDLPATDMFREQVEEFALAIRGQAVVEVTVDDSIRALAVVMAALESAQRSGVTVRL